MNKLAIENKSKIQNETRKYLFYADNRGFENL